MTPTSEQREEQQLQAELQTNPEQEGSPADQSGEQEDQNPGDLPPEADFDILPVVGLGGSAGSVQALQEFFSAMPADSGSAFVVVMHIAPDFDSQLHRVIGHYTKMPVVAVAGQTKVEANHVYVIPPGHHLLMEDGHLRLEPLENEFGKRVAVDLFFRTLAASHRSRAVAVVLSGLDSDGAVGIKRIKEMGGVTVAQAPEEAQHEGMPRAAINTGMVDWVLPVAQIAARLADFARNEAKIQFQLPPISNAEIGNRDAEEAEKDETALREVLAYVHTRTRRDFSHYKRATVLRRIMRRLQVNGLSNLPDYLHFLRSHAGEAGALLQDLLISVTNFFRDPEAFGALEALIPTLFKNKQMGDTVRVWVPGCATGEEAYSLAMMLVEYTDTLQSPPSIQLFATDIDEEALRTAREGRYPQAIAADVSPERLRRFFSLDHGMYRVRPDLRDMVLFAIHNLLGDAPFSRMDLLSCRNLLIYFGREAQEKALGVFHFSLKAEGTLFMGGSESPDGVEMFAPLDKKHRLYSRRSLPRASVPIPVFAPPQALEIPNLRELLSAVSLPQLPPTPALAPSSTSFGELHLQLLELMAPPSVLVNAEYDILHLSPEAGRFLAFAGGSATTNLLSVAQPSLRLELRAALFRALQSGEEVRVRGLTARIEGKPRLLDVRVRPLREPGRPEGEIYYLLVVFEERNDEAVEVVATPREEDGVAHRLNLELNQMKSYLRQTVEQYEATTEELKASNEELQAMNEELRSAGEELETSREELQSGNEELQSLNGEMKLKIEEISLANGDLNNLISSTDIATVFLDRNLFVKRYTPRALELFRLEPTDLGRRLSDIRNRLEIADEAFIEDAERVLDQLSTIEREIRTSEGRFYLLRVSPYRTQDNRIDGVVLAFVDISLRKRAEELLVESHGRNREILESISDAFYAVDEGFNFSYLNRRAEEWWNRSRESLLGKNLWTEIPAAVESESYEMHSKAMRERVPVQYEVLSSVIGRWVDVSIYPNALGGVSCYFRDITNRKIAEEELRRSEERSQGAMDAGRLFSWEMNPQTRHLEWSGNMREVIGFSLPDNIDWAFDLLHPDDREKTIEAINVTLGGGKAFESEFRLVNPANGEAFWFHSQGALRGSPRDGQNRFVGLTQNITERRGAEEALRLRASEEWLRSILASARDTAIFTFDPERRIQSWNRAAETMFGYPESEIIGQQSDILFVPEDLAENAPQNEVAQAASEGHIENERPRARKDGSRFVGAGSVTPLRGAAGQIIGFVSILRDLTDERRIQEQLRRASEADAFRVQLSDAMRSLNDAGEIQAQACRLLGEHLGVDRAYYVEISETEGLARVEQDFNRGDSPSLVGTFRMSDFGWTMPFYKRGETIVVSDARTSTLIPPADRSNMEAVQIGAHISVPLVKAGDVVGALCVTEPNARQWSDHEVEFVREVAERVWGAVTRAVAERSLEQSEEKYRTLFNEMDEGYGIIEVLLDENGEPSDYLMIEVNPQFERLTGLRREAVLGRRMREIVPEFEDRWYQMFGSVALSGEPVRVEEHVSAWDRWYDVYAFRFGEPSLRRVAIFYNDISERKRRERNAAFLADLSESLLPLWSEAEVVRSFGEKIGALTGAQVCAFISINPAQDEATVVAEWHRDEKFQLSGTFDIAALLSEEYRNQMRAGETVVIRDILRDARIANVKAFTSMGIGSSLCVPLARGGKWEFALSLYHSAPNPWRDDEIALLEEAAPRIWTKLERARADEALRQSEARSHALISNLPGGAAFIVGHDERYLLAEGEALDAVGMQSSDFVGRTLEETVPPAMLDTFRQMYRSAFRGDTFELEHQIGAQWFLTRGVPLRDGDVVVGALAVSYDITARKQIEEALRERESALRLVVESVTEYAIITLDLNGLITSWNPGAEHAFGWPSEEVIGQSTAIIFTPEDLQTGESDKEMREARDFGRAVDERWHLRRDGSRLFMSGVLSPLRDGGLDGYVKIARDLTREQQAESALRESEERLRTVVSNTPVVQFAVDPKGVFTLSEGSGLATLGLTAGEVVGRSVFDVYANTPEIGENVLRALGGEVFNTIQYINGLAFDTSFAPLRDESGQIVGATGVALDVTQRERASVALRESETRFRTLSDAVPQIIWTNEAGGTANYFNSRWFEYSGLSLEESFGPGWQAIVHPDDAPSSKDAWHRALERGEVFDTEYRLRRADGVYRWFIGRNVPLRDAQNRVTGWFGTATDINDLKEAEMTLRANGERFRAMFEQATAGVAEYDLNGKHIFANGTFCDDLGFSCDELLGKELKAIVHPEDWPHCHGLFERAKIEGGSFLNEKRLIRKNGEIIWIADSVSGIRDVVTGETQSVVAVCIDITQRKLAEEELQRAHGELEVRVGRRTRELALALERVSAEVEQRRQAEAGRAELMKRIVNTQEDERGRISRELHDNLGQHLTAVMLGLQALELQMEAFTGGRRAQSAPQLDKLRELVDGLMRAAHRQAWELRPAELDAMGLESALGQYIRDWSGRTGIEVDFQAIGWNNRPAPAVETTLYRVVQEALTNVIRHANATLVGVVIERNHNMASVIIEDDGDGFDTEQSTGRLGVLGMQERLSIVNGTLELESIPGEGTTVFARVPL